MTQDGLIHPDAEDPTDDFHGMLNELTEQAERAGVSTEEMVEKMETHIEEIK